MTDKSSELTLEQLQQFFEERKGVLNINPVSEEAGISSGHLRKILREQKSLTLKSIEKLLPVLKRYGYGVIQEENVRTTLTLEQLREFLSEREKTINISPLGEEAGLPKGYLNSIFRGESPLSYKSTLKLLPVLVKYGYII